jgi:hypothetical protein
MIRPLLEKCLFGMRVGGLALIYLVFGLLPVGIALAPILYVIYYPPR